MLIFAVSSSLTAFGDTKHCIDYAPTEVKSLTGAKGQQAYSLDFCRSTEYSNYYRCCFLKYEDKNERRQYHCMPLQSNDYWKIDETIGGIEKDLEVEIDSLDCSSSYLYVSLLLIFALLF